MEFVAPDLNITVVLPMLIVAATGLILMFVDFLVAEDQKELIGWLSLAGLVPALIVTLLQWNNSDMAFFNADGLPTVLLDNYSTFLNVIYLITAILAVMISIGYVRRAGIMRSEFYFLLLFSVCGMMLMGMANDLILIFLALELLSIPLYILSGFDLKRLESEESALKYFLLGAFSTGFLVFGIALVYGATGTTTLSLIAERIVDSIAVNGAIGLAGVALLLVGFGFKVGAVPFHMWTPDVYEGAPTAVTAFMSVGAKVAGFAAMIRVFVGAFEGLSADWTPAVAVIAALTLILGNIAAITQQNIKRMLAYSSIAHAGYILMGVAAGVSGVSAALYYMLAYMFTNLGAFAIVIAIERNEGEQGLLLEDYRGLAQRHLGYALALMYLMLSLIGIPLTGGFTGKFFVFREAIDAGLVWLAVIAALTSVISAFYYLRPVYYAFMYDGPATVVSSPRSLQLALLITVIATIILGVIPGSFYQIAQEAALPSLMFVLGG